MKTEKELLMEELKKKIYSTAIEFNSKQKLARDLSEKRSEYKSLLANQEAKIRIVEEEIGKLDKQGMELTRQLEELEMKNLKMENKVE